MSENATSPVMSPPQVGSGGLSEERKEELRRRWEQCFAGRVDPALLLRFPPKVMKVLRRDFPEPLKPDTHKRFLEDYALSFSHGHESPVVCLDTPDGVAIIAAGEELLWFYESATLEQHNRVRVVYPGPWEDVLAD